MPDHDDETIPPSPDAFATIDIHSLSKRVLSDGDLDALCDIAISHLSDTSKTASIRRDPIGAEDQAT